MLREAQPLLEGDQALLGRGVVARSRRVVHYLMFLEMLLQGAVHNKGLVADRALVGAELGVDPLVHVARAALREALAAKVAGVRLIPNVGPHVNLKVATLRESPSADVANERPDTVHFFVMRKGSGVGELQVAIPAVIIWSRGVGLVRLVLCMECWNGLLAHHLCWAQRGHLIQRGQRTKLVVAVAHMDSFVHIAGAALGEAFCAVSALIGLLARMGALVNLEIATFTERLPAKSANVIARAQMGLLVVGKQGRIHERLIAVTTALHR